MVHTSHGVESRAGGPEGLNAAAVDNAEPVHSWLFELRARRAAVALAASFEEHLLAPPGVADSSTADESQPPSSLPPLALQPRPPPRKSLQKSAAPCVEFARTGACRYGSRCAFVHASMGTSSFGEELRPLFADTIRAGRRALRSGDATRALREFEAAGQIANSLFTIQLSRGGAAAVLAAIQMDKSVALAALGSASESIAAAEYGLGLLGRARCSPELGCPPELELHARRAYVRARGATGAESVWLQLRLIDVLEAEVSRAPLAARTEEPTGTGHSAHAATRRVAASDVVGALVRDLEDEEDEEDEEGRSVVALPAASAFPPTAVTTAPLRQEPSAIVITRPSRGRSANAFDSRLSSGMSNGRSGVLGLFSFGRGAATVGCMKSF